MFLPRYNLLPRPTLVHFEEVELVWLALIAQSQIQIQIRLWTVTTTIPAIFICHLAILQLCWRRAYAELKPTVALFLWPRL